MSDDSTYKAPDITLLGEQHIAAYRESDGEVGYLWNGVPTLLLTTTGRKTGQRRTWPLTGLRVDGGWAVAASNGGHDHHPAWYLNLEAQSEVEVQVWGDRFKARARPATPEEKPVMWKQMVSVWPDYDTYQERTARQIPVVVLERI